MFSVSRKIYFLLIWCSVMTVTAEKSSDEIWRELVSFARERVPEAEDVSAWRSEESEDSADFFQLLSGEVDEDEGSPEERALASAPTSPEFEEANAEDSPVRGSSLVFVFDSTGSMKSELVQVKIGASKILEALRVNPEVPIHNYIMIPFNDPAMGPITVTTDHGEFRESMENITAWGGGDCPEITVEAVKKALQLSLPNSYIYVFTDAAAKDFRLKNEVLSLIQRKRSQVDFIMTGDCGTTTTEGYLVFEEIAATSSGQLYRLSKSEVKEVLKYVKVALRSNVVNLLSQQKPAPPKNSPDEHEVVVDETLQEFTISVSGKNPSINLTDPRGKSVEGPPKVTSLLHLDNVKIVSVKEPDPGSWKVLINSDSDYRLRSTGLSEVNFRHGFSTAETSSMRETSYRPLKGASCFLLIETSDLEKVHNITTVDLVDMKGDIIERLRLEPVPGKRGLYRTKSFLPPSNFFYLGILGYGKDGLPIKRITTTAINPQSPERPFVSMPTKVHIPLHSDGKLMCLVESVVPSTVLWYKNGEYTGLRLECSQTCDVAYPLEKVTSLAEGNYSCYASNIAGNSFTTTVVAVTGPVPVVKVSRSVSVAVGETVYLPCTVESEMHFTVRWNKFTARNYSTGTVDRVSKGEKMKNNTLLLGPIEAEDEGWYICVAESKAGRAEGRVFLQVRLPLTVVVHPKVRRYSKGESLRLSCTSSGRPQPAFQWRSNRQKINDEEETFATEERDHGLDLVIPYASREHEGTYTCYVETQEESGSAISELVYTERPTIIAESKSLSTKEGDEVRLKCTTEGAPRPEVTWFKDGDEIVTDSRKEVLESGELIVKQARASDSGEFSCRATNDLGTDMDHIVLFVGSSPAFLQTPKAIGVPAPEVKWNRVGDVKLNAKRMIVSPGGALKILKMDVEDVGEYECIAENVFGSISAKVRLDILGIEKPVPKETVKLSEIRGISGSDMSIPCGIFLGNPPGIAQWTKDGVSVGEDERKTIDGNGNLVIRNSTGSDRGSYSCHVSNWAGNTTRSFDVVISESPRIADNFTGNVNGKKGGEIVIPCPAEGHPSPTISWSKNGRPLPASPTIFQDENGSLIIRNLNEENSGIYVCVGRNSVGSASKAVSVQVQVPPAFAEEPLDQSLSIVEGYMVLLNCKSKAIPKATVQWFKNDQPLLEDEQQIDDQPENLRFTASTYDAGIYRCVLTNAVGSAFREFNVTVLVPPSVADFEDGKSIKAKAGAPLSMECKVRGVPKPTILWQRNGMYLTQNTTDVTVLDSGLLILQNVTKDSAGAYVCDAENLAGILQRIYYVQVHYAPRINGERNLTKFISVKEGEEVSLPCYVEGNPRPLVVWRKNGFLLHDDQMENLMLLGDNTLVLLQTKQESRGTYKCEATNEEGSSFQKYEIEVMSPPSLAPDDHHTQKKVNEGEPVVLTCPISNSIPPPTIQWLKDGMPLSRLLQERADEAKIKLSEDHRELSIAETHPSDRGNYSCTATNSAGRADARFLVDVLMTPHFEEFNHVAHRTILTGGEVALNCSVSGNPQPKVTWRKETAPITPENNPGVHISLDKQHLVIRSGKVHHSGTYICTAVNEVSRKEREFYVSVLEPPVISGSEEEVVEAISGSSLSLHCPFSGVPRPRILWIKIGESKMLFKSSEEYLEMRDLTCEDAGIYVCEVTNTAGTKTKKFNVSVLEPPDIESHNVVEEVVAREGGSLILRCKAKGHPKPDITWFHGGEMIRNAKAARNRRRVPELLAELDVTEDGLVNLTITNVTLDYGGLYTVLASNRAGIAEKNFQVSIHSQPRIRESRSDPELVTVPKAFPIVLKCSVSGEPLPEIQWFHNGHPVLEDNHISLIDNELEIVNSNENHSGNFTCLAHNPVGNVTLNFIVNVVVPPTFANTETVLQVKANENIVLNCGDGGEGRNTAFSWLRKSINISNTTKFSVSVEGRELTIMNATFADSGDYVCIASNIAGFSKRIFQVYVVEPPVLIEPTPESQQRVELYHPVSLRCPFTSRSESHFTWHKDGKMIRGHEDDRIRTAGPLLMVTSTIAEDAGEYKCITENSAGTGEYIYEVKVYVAAEWNEWSDWSICTTSCGLGEQIRRRTCRTDGLERGFHVEISSCIGKNSERRACFNQCEVNGGWGSWSNWTPYSGTCGKVVRRKVRPCNNPRPVNGGRMCSEPAVMEEYTNLGACPLHGEWSEWSEWSPCSKSCDGGVKQRERKCDSPSPQNGGYSCRGPSTDVKLCNKQKCFGEWLDWSEWGPCSATCGRGQRKRHRRCKPSGEECAGENLQIVKCIVEKCVGSGVPPSANFQVVGNVNGRNVDQSFDVSIDNLKDERLISVNMNDILKQEEKWFPYAQFLLSPLSWSTAYEKDDAENGFSLTDGNYFSLSDIKFATGEGLIVKHKGEGVDSDGALQVHIEVVGELPLVEPHASVLIENMEQEFVQTGLNRLYSSVRNNFDVEGEKLPFTWNSSIQYNNTRGTMPYLVEKLSVKDIRNNYDPDTQNVTYVSSATIGKGYEENKCPRGFLHEPELMHCQDVDECEESRSPCEVNQRCENTFGSFICVCNEGFVDSGNSTGCFDVDECYQKPPVCSHFCHNNPGSFACSCPYGFYLDENLRTCKEFIPGKRNAPSEGRIRYGRNFSRFAEFRVGRGEQSRNGTKNGDMEACPPGFYLLHEECKDRNECFEEANLCDEDEACLNTLGSYQCLSIPCPQGFNRDFRTKNCIKHCEHEKSCLSSTVISEMVVFNTVTLTSTSPLRDILQLDIFPQKGVRIVATKFRIGESGELFRVRESRGRASLYALRVLNKDTLYRVKIEAKAYNMNSQLAYIVEFVVFIIVT